MVGEGEEHGMRWFGGGEGGWDEVVGEGERRMGLGALGEGEGEGGWDEMVGEGEGGWDEMVGEGEGGWDEMVGEGEEVWYEVVGKGKEERLRWFGGEEGGRDVVVWGSRRRMG